MVFSISTQCGECGAPVPPSGKHDGEMRFCCREHRDAFGNRRKTRGAQIYDLMMGMRYERKRATELGVWAVACRMMSEWNEEDKKAGRRSAQLLDTVMSHNVRYRGTKTKIR